MRWRRFVFLGLMFAAGCADAQVVVQTWVDPCTGAVQTATFPVSGPGVLVMYRGVSKVFTAQQAAAGELQAWVAQVTASVPCPVNNNPVVTQTTAAVATSAATAAASAAASSAASAAASSAATAAVPAAPPPTPAAPAASSSSSAPASSSEPAKSEAPAAESKEAGGGEGGGESKEGEGEQKSESKKDEKKGGARTNPVMIASDLTLGQNPDGTMAQIATVGMSQSSLTGESSWGVTGMVWMTFDQGALSGSYTKMGFAGGKLTTIHSVSNTTAYAKGTWINIVGYTLVKPSPKWGVSGVNASAIVIVLPDGVSYATSATAFWMHPPIVVNERVSLAPQVFVMSAPLSYNDVTKLTINKQLSAMLGSSVDYKLTKRFGMTGAYRAMVSPGAPTLSFVMIGSRMIL